MNRQTTDVDVAFLVNRIRRICVGIVQAHEHGFGPSEATDQSVADILSNLIRTRILDTHEDVGRHIGEYYSAVYRYMIGRGSPSGVADQWVATAGLFRAIGDAYADVIDEQNSESIDLDEHREVLQNIHHQADQLRLIAGLVDTKTVTDIASRVTAVVESLSTGAVTSPLSDDDRQLLHLLVAGNKVEEIASHLKVSSRTIHRRLQSVWDQVGASSRTEGIAIISARGWLD